MPDGPMDVQDLLSWGTVIPERATRAWEYERLDRLCDLADTLGIDAMQLNFEIMLCNFAEGAQIQTLSRLEDEERLPHHAYSYIHSSAWHDHYPGETRIHLDLTHLISLYDVVLAPSLVSRRYGQARRDNRVLGIDARDTAAVLARVREIPFNSTPSASGIDWRTLFQVIRDRYATRLDVLQSILLEDVTPARAFVLVQTALAPYRLHGAVPPLTGSDTTWAAPVFQLCASAHTLFVQSIQPKLTASERLLLAAAQETSREICRTLVNMWAEGVLALRDSATLSNSLTPKWKADVDQLMDWLGWDLWVKCRPACAFDESCYLPGAPLSMGEWNMSTPRCIRVSEPYSGIEEDWGSTK
ncbi:hypothetical protein B0H13DRAFT_2387461 [Mycena leptocephala]|nr:hypothetical protein B0H13DRAFT_2387461 [Mycena leptocephala]